MGNSVERHILNKLQGQHIPLLAYPFSSKAQMALNFSPYQSHFNFVVSLNCICKYLSDYNVAGWYMTYVSYTDLIIIILHSQLNNHYPEFSEQFSNGLIIKYNINNSNKTIVTARLNHDTKLRSIFGIAPTYPIWVNLYRQTFEIIKAMGDYIIKNPTSLSNKRAFANLLFKVSNIPQECIYEAFDFYSTETVTNIRKELNKINTNIHCNEIPY